MELNPTFPEAYYGYGRLLVEMGETQKGLENGTQSAKCQLFVFIYGGQAGNQ
jgi:hypothetical protein